jgi:hypothetical protein
MSSLPTVIMENIVIDLPDERSQLKMRSQNAFIDALRRATQTSLYANPGREAGTAPGLICEPDM